MSLALADPEIGLAGEHCTDQRLTISSDAEALITSAVPGIKNDHVTRHRVASICDNYGLGFLPRLLRLRWHPCH
jgi:hypothetical protein